jgi:small basic protein
MIESILPFDLELGIFAGLAIAVSGYLKAYTKEKFNPERFITTVLLGAVVGGVLSFVSTIDGAVMMFLATAGTVTIVDDLVKGFLRIEGKKEKK